MKDCPEGFEDQLCEFLDHFEGEFNDIRDLLEITGLRDLGRIEDAHDIAKKAARDLY